MLDQPKEGLPQRLARGRHRRDAAMIVTLAVDPAFK
jgi:hypothetical protein